MQIEEFVAGLEKLGFRDSGFKVLDEPWMLSFNPPESLLGMLALNIGPTKKDGKVTGYAVSIQRAPGKEVGGLFVMRQPDEALLKELRDEIESDAFFLRNVGTGKDY
jgi:hypothetical protein